MATLAELDPQDTRLHLKARKCINLIAPMSVPFPETLTAAGGTLVDLKAAGFLPLGRSTRDGVTFPRNISTEDQLSHGYLEPSDSDRTEDTTQISLTLQQPNARVLALFTGASLDAMQKTAAGDLWLPRAQIPADQDYRWVTIAETFDKTTGEPVYFGKAFPRVRVTEPGEQALTGEGWVEYPLTLTAYFDADAGTAVVDFIAGTGFRSASTALGYTAGA